MRFRLAALSRIQGGAGEPAGAPGAIAVQIECPRCGLAYRTEIDRERGAGGLEEWVYVAGLRLSRECPDHGYQFTVREWRA